MNNEEIIKGIIQGLDSSLLHLTPKNVEIRVPKIRRVLEMLETEIKIYITKKELGK